MNALGKRDAIEIRIGDVSLAAKLDALAAALLAVRDAHRETMGAKCWPAINRALDNLAEATLHAEKKKVWTPAGFIEQ